jgi:uncharacterized membrane protein
MADTIRFFSAGPLSLLAIILLVVLIVILVPLFILGLIGAAFTRLGFSWVAALAAVFLMLLGSVVNIPLWHIRRDMVRVSPAYSFAPGTGLSMQSTPVWETKILLNLGGAVIPVCLSAYLLAVGMSLTGPLLLTQAGIAILIVSCVTYLVTRPRSGIGIRVPLLVPGLVALLVAVLITGGTGSAAAVTAFIGGTAGTLLGGNIVHLMKIRDLEIAEMSIGGAGTFGTVFLCCILPALVS